MRRFWPVALLAGLLFSFAVAACGGSDAGDGDTRQGASPTPTSEPSDDGEGAEGDDVLSLLQRVAENAGRTTYRVVYEIEGGDPDSGEIRGTLTMAADPPKQLFSLSGLFAGEESTLTIIDDGESSYLCFDAEGNQSCLRSGSGGSETVPLPTFLEVDELIGTLARDGDTTAREVQGREIAGRDARCFEIASSEGDGLVCIAKDDAVLLLIEGTFEGAVFNMRAVEIADAPTAADFEPPYPVSGG